MIVQSHSGELAFLPAIPSAWREGSVVGLRARGAVEVDLTWREGKAETATLRPAVTGTQVLRAPKGQTIVAVEAPGHALELRPRGDGTCAPELTAGQAYRVRFSR